MSWSLLCVVVLKRYLYYPSVNLRTTFCFSSLHYMTRLHGIWGCCSWHVYVYWSDCSMVAIGSCFDIHTNSWESRVCNVYFLLLSAIIVQIILGYLEWSQMICSLSHFSFGFIFFLLLIIICVLKTNFEKNFWSRLIFGWDKVNSAMGVSGKWIKALVGLKKSEKSHSSVKDENVSTNSFQC